MQRQLNRLPLPPLANLAVMARDQHVGNFPVPELRRPRVVRIVEQPARKRIAGDRIFVADDTRNQPRHRVDDDERRQFAAAEHVVADRQSPRSPDSRARDRRSLRIGRRESRRDRGSTSRAASVCEKRRPCGDTSTMACGSPASSRIASTALNSGSGFSTIPGPPPYGTSSTLRCRSSVNSRRSRARTASTLRWIAFARIPSARAASIIRGKIVTMSNRI